MYCAAAVGHGNNYNSGRVFLLSARSGLAGLGTTRAGVKRARCTKKKRPAKPARNPHYPTKAQIVLTLLEQFKFAHPDIRVRMVAVDALYGTGEFLDKAAIVFGCQVISQIRGNQKVGFRKKLIGVAQYFQQYPGQLVDIKIRGGETITAHVSSARLYVDAHKKKRFVIALKYQGEQEYRYLVASDISWRTIDIVQGYTLRWLAEVFFEDWKLYQGWGQLTKQLDDDGSSRSLILSLLLDHCLLTHPQQLARLENNLPAATVGSLLEKIRIDSLLNFIHSLLSADNPQQKLESLAKAVEDIFK